MTYLLACTSRSTLSKCRCKPSAYLRPPLPISACVLWAEMSFVKSHWPTSHYIIPNFANDRYFKKIPCEISLPWCTSQVRLERRLRYSKYYCFLQAWIWAAANLRSRLDFQPKTRETASSWPSSLVWWASAHWKVKRNITARWLRQSLRKSHSQSILQPGICHVPWLFSRCLSWCIVRNIYLVIVHE